MREPAQNAEKLRRIAVLKRNDFITSEVENECDISDQLGSAMKCVQVNIYL